MSISWPPSALLQRLRDSAAAGAIDWTRDDTLAMSAAERDCVYRPLRDATFYSDTFESDMMCDLVPRLARLTITNRESAYVALYASVLMLYAYSEQYHWNASNRPDEHVYVAVIARAAMELPTTTASDARQFLEWVSRRYEVDSLYRLACSILWWHERSQLLCDAAREALHTASAVKRPRGQPWVLSLSHPSVEPPELATAWNTLFDATGRTDDQLRRALDRLGQ